MQARGNTRIIIEKVGEIQNLVGKAQSRIDTKDQHEIRAFLEKAHKICIEIRDMYDPV